MRTVKITSPLSLVFIISTLAGCAVHFYLAQQHIVMKYTMEEGSALCNMSDFLSCGPAIVSSYSELFGIPLAFFGFFTNLLILYFTLKVLVFGEVENAHRSAGVAMSFATFSFLVSIVMAGISLFMLKSLCPFCTAAYIFSFITLATCYVITKPVCKGASSDVLKPLVLAFAFMGIASVASAKVVMNKYTSKDIREFSQLRIQQWDAESPKTIDPVEPLKLGPDSAKMKIVEYADFLCPHCKTAYGKLHTFAKAHPDVQILFQSFPLDGCSGSAENPGLRCQLAMAAFCAQKENKGWDAHAHFFGNQQSIGESGDIKPAIDGLVAKAGLDAAKLDACMKDADTLDKVKKQLELGKSLGVQGTPTLFINNKAFVGGPHLPTLQEIHQKL